MGDVVGWLLLLPFLGVMCLPNRILIPLYLISAVALEAFTLTGFDLPIRVTYENVFTALVSIRFGISFLISHEYRDASRSLRWILVPYMVFLVTLVPSVLLSFERALSLKAFARYLTYPVIFLGAAVTAARERQGLVERSMVCGVALATGVALYQFWDPEFVAGNREWAPELMALAAGDVEFTVPRLNGTVNNANAYGMLLVFALGILHVTAKRQGLAGVRSLLLAGVFLVSLIFTFSRSSWVALAILAVVCGSAAKGRGQRPTIRIALVAIAFGGIALATGAVETRTSDLLTDQNSLTWRLLVWQGILESQESTPNILFGKGLDTVVLDNPAQEDFRAHNSYVAFYHDSGVCGLVGFVSLFGWLLLASGRLVFRVRKHEALNQRAALMLGATVMMVVISVTEEPLMTPVVALFYFLLMIVNHQRICCGGVPRGSN
jgi:O-antigen ligase